MPTSRRPLQTITNEVGIARIQMMQNEQNGKRRKLGKPSCRAKNIGSLPTAVLGVVFDFCGCLATVSNVSTLFRRTAQQKKHWKLNCADCSLVPDDVRTFTYLSPGKMLIRRTFSKLRSLKMGFRVGPDYKLSALRDCGALEVLELNCYVVEISELGKLNSLTELCICPRQEQLEETLDVLKPLGGLRRLSLLQQLDRVSFQRMQQLKELHTLQIAVGASDVNVGCLGNLPNLAHLSISGAYGDQLRHAVDLENLLTLQLNHCKCTPGVFRDPWGCKKLTQLSICSWQQPGKYDLTALCGLPIESFRYDGDIFEFDIIALEGWKALSNVSLQGTKGTPLKVGNEIGKIKGLKQLSLLRWCSVETTLTRLKGLTEVTLGRYCTLHPDFAESLFDLPKLHTVKYEEDNLFSQSFRTRLWRHVQKSPGTRAGVFKFTRRLWNFDWMAI